MHVVERVDFRLNIVAVCSVGVENFCPWWWCIELTLLSFVVVVIVLALVVNLMINVINRVGKGIKVFFLMFLRHIGVVFFLFKSDLYGNTTAV